MYIEKVVDWYNVLVGAAVTFMTALFGIYWYIFAAYMLLNVFDWLTGWYKSRKLKTESSKVGLKGILKKLGYWVVVAIAFILSSVFVHMGTDVLHVDLSFLNLIGWFTLACLLVNEIRSILENLVECGYSVPAVLTKGLAVADRLLNEDDKEDEEHVQNKNDHSEQI